MAGDRLTVCERDCFHCPYPDRILDDADISLGEWAESTARDKRLQAAERSDREKKVAACKAAYYQANKEKVAAYQAAYYQANKEKIAAYNAAYYQANKEKIAAYNAAYRQANKEKIAAYQAAYRQANKEKIAARRKERRDAEKRRGGDGEADGPGAADAGAGVHTAEAGARGRGSGGPVLPGAVPHLRKGKGPPGRIREAAAGGIPAAAVQVAGKAKARDAVPQLPALERGNGLPHAAGAAGGRAAGERGAMLRICKKEQAAHRLNRHAACIPRGITR